MRYGLRSLLILMAIGPPILAGAWIARSWLPFVIGLAGFGALFAIPYWAVVQAQSRNPRARGCDDYPIYPPPPG